MPIELFSDSTRPIDPDVYNKYLGNLRKGRANLAKGNYNPFQGDPPARINNGITLRTYYDNGSEQLLRERFIGPIEKLAEKNGVFLYSGNLWTLHATVSNLIYQPGVTPGTYTETLVKVLSDPRVIEATRSLCGQEVDYDFLFGGNAIALAVSRLPTQVLEARRQLTQVAKDLGLGEMDYANIYHTTLTRIIGVYPQALQVGGLASFGRDLMRLHHEVFSHPLHAKIDKALIVPDTQTTINHGNMLPTAISDAVSQRIKG